METTGTKVAKIPKANPGPVITIEPQGNHFEINPAMAHAKKGDTIRWVNETGGSIDIFFPDSAEVFDLPPKGVYSVGQGMSIDFTVKAEPPAPDNIHYYTVYVDSENGNSGFARGHSCGGVSVP